MNWYDVMIANLLDRSNLDVQNVDDISKPTVVALANVISDGITQNWVDLSTYIALLDSSNTQMVATNDRPRVASNYIPMLKWWFLSAEGKSPETTILASMLLNAFLTETTVTELFIALQMNENGAAAFDVDPFAAFQAGVAPKTLPSNVILNIVLQNFCAKVIIPTAAQYAPGRSMDVVTFYFEINQPPTQLSTLTAADVWTWTLPFSNDVWTHSQAVFQHTGTFKVKMIYPLCQDATTYCSFDANFQVGHKFNRRGKGSLFLDFQDYSCCKAITGPWDHVLHP